MSDLMQIKFFLQAFNLRGVGHTTALLEGAMNTPRCLFVVNNEDTKRYFKIRYPELQTATIYEHTKIRFHEGPIVVDHFALQCALQEEYGNIDKLNSKIDVVISRLQLKNGMVDQLLAENKNLKSQVREMRKNVRNKKRLIPKSNGSRKPRRVRRVTR